MIEKALNSETMHYMKLATTMQANYETAFSGYSMLNIATVFYALNFNVSHH